MAKVKYLTLNVAIISRKGSSRNTGNQEPDAKNGEPRKRSAGVAAAAYRSGQALYDEQAREQCDYNPKEKEAAPVMDARQAAAYRSGSVLGLLKNRCQKRRFVLKSIPVTDFLPLLLP